MPTPKTLTSHIATNRKYHDYTNLLTTDKRTTRQPTGESGRPEGGETAAVAPTSKPTDPCGNSQLNGEPTTTKTQHKNQHPNKRETSNHYEKRSKETRRPITEAPESARASEANSTTHADRQRSAVLSRVINSHIARPAVLRGERAEYSHRPGPFAR
jgi:hypothetical protein